MSPKRKVSGDRVLTSKTRASANRATTALRLAASSLYHSHGALGTSYRLMQASLAPPKAITATAHKLARFVFSMLKHGSAYVDAGQDYDERQYQERVVRNLQQRAKALGFDLIPHWGRGSDLQGARLALHALDFPQPVTFSFDLPRP